jgi:hypothetical protein
MAMPRSTSHVYCVREEASAIAEQNSLVREMIARCLETLKTPMPDTFLGRRTQEPFPREESRLKEAAMLP